MATNEPSKPDNIINIDPGKQKTIEEQAAPGQPLEAGGEVPIPEMTTGETVAPAHEGETVLENVGAELTEADAPVDIGGADIPGPGDVGETEKTAPPAPESDKPSRRGRPPKADKGDKPGADAPKKEPKAEKAPKADKPGKQKQAAGVGGVGGSVKEEAPPVTSADALRQAGIMVEQPPAPLDATRNGETEQIVYLNLSELHAFKNHPFGVRDDSEMKALVESVKNGGVNQPALVRPRECIC